MIRVQPGSSQPIYLQIVDALSRAIANGELKPGDGLPSIRELAAELVVNPNTVVRAFGELARLGLVVAQPGRGYAVIARRQVFTPEEYQRQLLVPAQALVATAVRLGATLAVAKTAVESAWNQGTQDGKAIP